MRQFQEFCMFFDLMKELKVPWNLSEEDIGSTQTAVRVFDSYTGVVGYTVSRTWQCTHFTITPKCKDVNFST